MSHKIQNEQLNEFIKSMKLSLKKHSASKDKTWLRSVKKKVRGARRRRNWLMRTGQWPQQTPQDGTAMMQMHVKKDGKWVKVDDVKNVNLYLKDVRLVRL